MDASVTDKDIVNRTISLFQKRDTEIRDIFNRIEEETQLLTSSEETTDKKYKQVVSIEFLLFRARVLVENEHITVKSIVSDISVSPAVKAIMSKRDQYLAQVSAKLSTITSDISVLEKSVYAEQTIFKH